MKKTFKNSVFLCLLIVGICLGLTTLGYGQIALVSIEPSELDSLSVGEQFTIYVKILAPANVAGYQFTLNFDSSTLRHVSTENADYLPAGAFVVGPTVSVDSVTFGATSKSGAAAAVEGTLAAARFEVVASKASLIELTDVVISDSSGREVLVSIVTNSVRVSPTTTRDTSVQVETPRTSTEAQAYIHQNTLVRHTNFVRALAVSPDGSTLASGGGDRNIHLWDARTGAFRRTLVGHARVVTALAFSPDGNLLASASGDQTVRLWNLQTGRHTLFPGHTAPVYALAFSSTGSIASGGSDNTVHLWDRRTGRRQILQGHTDWILGIAFSKDGSLLASASRDGKIKVWDAKGRFLRDLTGHTNYVTSVAFASTGELVSGSRDRTVRTWDPQTGRELRILRGHTRFVNSVAVSANGTIASGSAAVRLWNLQGEHLGTLDENTGMVRAVAFSPGDLHLASGDESGNVLMYENVIDEMLTGDNIDEGIPDTDLRPATADFTYERTFIEDARPVRALAFSPIGIVLASGGYNRAINVWNAATSALFFDRLTGHTRTVTAIAFSPSDPLMLASASVDGSIRLWNSVTGQPVRTLAKAHAGGVQSVAFSPDGRLLASGGRDNTVRLWDPETGRLIAALPGHTDWVLGVAFSPTGLLASASRDRTIRLWNSSGQYLRSLRGHTDFVTSVAFASTGELVSGSRDMTVRSWNPQTGRRLRILRGHTNVVNSVAVSVNGMIASGATTVRLWDLQTGQPFGTLDENTGGVRTVAFSPSEHWFASGDEDGNVVLWSQRGGTTSPIVDSENFVHIPDPNLRAAIENALGKSQGDPITPIEMQKLTDFEASSEDIQDLTGLEFATNLTALTLTNNWISDISPLTQLKKLEALGLGYNRISDLSAFTQFNSLIELDLGGNGISDISPLKELKQLTWLYLSYNLISDVSPLAQLKNLKALYLSHNQIVDFSPIAELVRHLERYENGNQNVVGPDAPVVIPDPNLRLAIEHTLGKVLGATITKGDMQTLTILETPDLIDTIDLGPIRALTGIEFATNLTKLDISYSGPSDISALADLKNLTELRCVSILISDISALAGLKNLTHLDIPDNGISDISPLSGLTELRELNLTDNQLSDVSALSGLRNLRKLYLGKNQLSDISSLSGLRNLTELILWGNQLSDLPSLSDLRSLTQLNLSENQLSDISSLSGLRNLTELDLSENELSDISALSSSRNLTSLLLWGNKLSDISALSSLRNLTSLFLNENRLSDISALSGLKNLDGLDISNNEITDVSALSGLTNLKNLFLSYNRIVDFGPIAEVEKNLEYYEKEPQLKSLIPTSVRLSGPTTVTSVVRDYTFTAKVTNAHDQGLSGVEVKLNGDETVQTNSRGEAKFDLNFSSVGAHDITVTVRDKESGTELREHFPNRVVVPEPHSIAIVADHREVQAGDFYVATFVVRSADGQVLEGYPVKMRVGQWTLAVTGTEKIPGVETFHDFIGSVDHPSNKEFDVWKWRVRSVPGDTSLATNLTDHKGEAVCCQRLSSTGPYAVSAAVVVDGQELLAESFSDSGSESLNKEYHRNYLAWYERVPNGWQRIDGHPTPPPYRINVVPVELCGATVPSPDILKRAKELNTLTEALSRRGYYTQTSGSPSFFTTQTGTSSLNPDLKWTPITTQAPDLGVAVITAKFMDGTKDQKKKVKEAFAEWQKHARIFFLFIDETGDQESKLEDVNGNAFGSESLGLFRIYKDFHDFKAEDVEHLPDLYITFDESGREKMDCGTNAAGCSDIGSDAWIKYTSSAFFGEAGFGQWLDRVGASLFDWAGYKLETVKTERERKELDLTANLNNPTMWLETEFSHGTALHEIGHALGFHHPQNTPAFAEAFEWPPKNASILKDIKDEYGDNAEGNVLKVVQLPDSAGVDLDSIMTYKIPANWLNSRSNTSLTLQKIAKSTGISRQRRELSTGDKLALASVYGETPETGELPIYVISGWVEIEGKDHETWPFSDETVYEMYPLLIYMSPQDEKYVFTPFTELKWGGECRVEVDVGTKGLTQDGQIQMAARVRLYEGTHVDTFDLEDEEEDTFTVSTHTIRDPKEIYVKNRGTGGGDDATVTFTVRIDKMIGGDNSAAAPSILTDSRSSFPDINGDGQVDVADLLLVSNYFGEPAPVNLPVDVNRDGIVTIADLVQVAQYLGQSMYASAPAEVIVPGELTYETVQSWIDSARLADDGSLVFQQGIAKLEYLLTLIIPEETVLLHNYPNPFNPETWIPYHLSEPAEVTLRIYSIDGKVVRHLDLGHQAAGYYRSKSRAAHWDGRNNVGERVASGIYFYTLTAGEFFATKKLLILK